MAEGDFLHMIVALPITLFVSVLIFDLCDWASSIFAVSKFGFEERNGVALSFKAVLHIDNNVIALTLFKSSGTILISFVFGMLVSFWGLYSLTDGIILIALLTALCVKLFAIVSNVLSIVSRERDR
jgi:hypothetical protein